MFSLLTKEGRLALRLPADERELFLEKFETELCVQYGLKKTQELKVYFDISYQYVSSLKPKPTKKKGGAKEKESKS
jgi:hypothetical protein